MKHGAKAVRPKEVIMEVVEEPAERDLFPSAERVGEFSLTEASFDSSIARDGAGRVLITDDPKEQALQIEAIDSRIEHLEKVCELLQTAEPPVRRIRYKGSESNQPTLIHSEFWPTQLFTFGVALLQFAAPALTSAAYTTLGVAVGVVAAVTCSMLSPLVRDRLFGGQGASSTLEKAESPHAARVREIRETINQSIKDGTISREEIPDAIEAVVQDINSEVHSLTLDRHQIMDYRAKSKDARIELLRKAVRS